MVASRSTLQQALVHSCPAKFLSGKVLDPRKPAFGGGLNIRSSRMAAQASAVAAESTNLKRYKVADMSEQQLLDCTARPRIDFESILNTVCI
jgi:hypothetical protein